MFGNVQEMVEIVSMTSVRLFIRLELRPLPPMDPARGDAMWVKTASWSSPGEAGMLDLSEWSFALAHVALLAAEGEFVVQMVH